MCVFSTGFQIFSGTSKLQLLTAKTGLIVSSFLAAFPSLSHVQYPFFSLPDQVLALDSLSQVLPLGKPKGQVTSADLYFRTTLRVFVCKAGYTAKGLLKDRPLGG